MTICNEQLSNGVCTRENCPHNHNAIFCEDCGTLCSSNFAYQQHIKGKFHRRQIADVQLPPEVASQRCATCQRNIPSSSWTVHIRSKGHSRQLRFINIKTVLENAEKDKHGILVEDELIDFGVVDEAETGKEFLKTITIRNTVPQLHAVLDRCRLSSKINGRRQSDFNIPDNDYSNQPIPSLSKLQMEIAFVPRHQGHYQDRIELNFEDKHLNQKFVITRKIVAVVINKFDYEAIKPIAPYVPKERTNRVLEGEIVPGVKPEAFAAIKWVVPLPLFTIPTHLSRVLSGDSSSTKIIRERFLPPILNEETYGRFFSILLHLEEYQSEQDLQFYDMNEVTLQASQRGKLYFLDVPGLAEKRPSVIIGDRILVRPSNSSDTTKWFEGFVHVVELRQVGLAFNSTFHQFSGQKYTIRFKLGRLPLRRMHQALDTVFHPPRILFPASEHTTPLRKPSTASMNALVTFDKLLKNNPPQLEAVSAILNLPKGSPPFVIFGPPGTGKTVTVVEAIKQLLHAQPHARILACAPSNSAADLIAERLVTLSINELFRLNAPSRSGDSLPRSLDKFTTLNDRKLFNIPKLEKLKTYRVIVSTCISASVCYGVGVPRGHFTHIFVDEAGQASEPEVMIPIKTMGDTGTNVILSGDPKQLGPIVRSRLARELGLTKSYLDRLMAQEIYDPTSYNGITVRKLIKNWRSHNAILRFPNDKFYQSELQCCGDPVVINSFLRSSVLAKRDFPVVFHSIVGNDEREANSPSFFNRGEASLVKKYVQDLMSDSRVRISNDDIGIISPYNAQCQKIRTLLKLVAPNIKVGSVEQFQGQERRVIIISAVRSSMEFVEFDLRHVLGFVANPRRFNVAVTRAKALLIVVGDPSVLGLDPLWRSFLNYVYLNGGWKGPAMDWDANESVDDAGGYDGKVRSEAERELDALCTRLKGLSVDGAVDEMEAAFERPWREDE